MNDANIAVGVQYHVPCALRIASETGIVELFREAGPKGMHIKDIATQAKVEPSIIGRHPAYDFLKANLKSTNQVVFYVSSLHTIFLRRSDSIQKLSCTH